MTTYSMTAKQSEALTFITGYIHQHGIGPSFDEIKDALALKSKSGVHRIITALVERGHLVKLPNRARTLALPNAEAVSERDMHLVRALAHLDKAKWSNGWMLEINSAIKHIKKARKA